MSIKKLLLILATVLVCFGGFCNDKKKDPKTYREVRIFITEIKDKLIKYEDILRNDTSIEAFHLKAEIYALLNHNKQAGEILEGFHDTNLLNIEEKRILFLWYYYNKNYHKCINLIYDLNKSEKYRNFSKYYLEALSDNINYKETSELLIQEYSKILTPEQKLDVYLYSENSDAKKTKHSQISDSIKEKYHDYIYDTLNLLYADYHSYIIENHESWNIKNNKNALHKVKKLIKIISNEGKEINSTITVKFNALNQKVIINRINLYKPDGTIYNVPVDSYTSIYSLWNGDYSSDKEMRITIPQLELNTVMLLDYNIETVNQEPLSYPGFKISLDSDVPVKNQNYKLEISENIKANFRFSDNIIFEKSINSGDTLFYWELNNSFPGKIEEYNDIFYSNKFIEVSLIPSWEKLHEWLANGYLETKLELSQQMEILVDSLTNSINSPKDKVKELYYWVSKNINYIALEYGKGSIMPRTAQTTYKDGFGDCKDQTILFISFLNYLGIDAYPALLNISSRNIIDTTFSSFNFNHCITYIELNDTSFFLDPVKNNNSFNYLFPSNQNRLTYIIKHDNHCFVQTPLIKSESNLEKREITIDIDNNNNIYVSKKITNKGIMGITYKNFFKQIDKSDIQEVIEYDLYQFCPGAELISYNITSIQNDFPFIMSETFEVDNWLQNINNTLYIFKIPTLYFSFDETTSTDRSNPIYYQTSALKKYEITINYPDNYDILFIVKNKSLSNKYIDFSYTVNEGKNKLILDIEYNRKTDLIPTGDYASVKEIHDMILNKIKEQFVFNLKDNPIN